jgi:hypothetical protein
MRKNAEQDLSRIPNAKARPAACQKMSCHTLLKQRESAPLNMTGGRVRFSRTSAICDLDVVHSLGSGFGSERNDQILTGDDEYIIACYQPTIPNLPLDVLWVSRLQTDFTQRRFAFLQLLRRRSMLPMITVL